MSMNGKVLGKRLIFLVGGQMRSWELLFGEALFVKPLLTNGSDVTKRHHWLSSFVTPLTSSSHPKDRFRANRLSSTAWNRLVHKSTLDPSIQKMAYLRANRLSWRPKWLAFTRLNNLLYSTHLCDASVSSNHLLFIDVYPLSIANVY